MIEEKARGDRLSDTGLPVEEDVPRLRAVDDRLECSLVRVELLVALLDRIGLVVLA